MGGALSHGDSVDQKYFAEKRREKIAMKLFVLLKLACSEMTGVGRHIVNGNEPLVEDCPLNKCYSLIGGDVPKCVAKESCYQIDCHDGGVDIRFSKHLIYGDPRYFFEQDAPLSRLFFYTSRRWLDKRPL